MIDHDWIIVGIVCCIRVYIGVDVDVDVYVDVDVMLLLILMLVSSVICMLVL